jgi:hypothetical protein
MTKARFHRRPGLIQDRAKAAEKSLAKQRGERYFARAKWWFDSGRYHTAAWLCRVGLRLSTGPFMLAVRDQLDDLAANCDLHLDAAGPRHVEHLCSIDITIRGTTAPKRYLSKLSTDELVELELQLVEFADRGSVEKFLISPREPFENLGELLVWVTRDATRGRQITHEKAQRPRYSIVDLVRLQIEKAAEYHDGLVTFPAFMYESLKQALGIEFESEYLDARSVGSGELLHKPCGTEDGTSRQPGC